MSKIVLKGYYGKGNFGDDILMIVTFRLIKELFPTSEILICSDGHQSSYIKNLVGNVSIVKSNTPLKVDWIVHGGGGVYFDFKEGNLKFSLLNFFIRLISYKGYKRIYRIVQQSRNNLGIISTSRLGLGIGVGTYTTSSQKFYADILSLADYNYLIVRDNDSALSVKNFKFNYPVKVATDLAFLYEYWTQQVERAKKETNKSIGFILRDWPIDNHEHVNILLEVAAELELQGFQLIIFSLDKFEDAYFSKAFSKFKFIAWDPFNMTVDDFLMRMSETDLIVSSRAHGCIISACLGIPSVCLGIEPKLKKISEMLQGSARYVPQPFDKNSILLTIKEAFGNLEQSRIAVEEDVRANREIMKREIVQLQQFIKGV